MGSPNLRGWGDNIFLPQLASPFPSQMVRKYLDKMEMTWYFTFYTSGVGASHDPDEDRISHHKYR